MTRNLLTVSITIAATLSLGVAQAQDGLPSPEAELALERELTERVKAAYEATSFEDRNRASAEAVRHEAALQANRAIGLPESPRQAEIERVFTVATRQAGEAFRGAFTPGGEPIPEREADYKRAMSAAGGIAFRALGPTLQQVEPGLSAQGNAAAASAERAVKRATIDDVAKIVAKDLGLREPPARGLELIRTIDRAVPEGDLFHKEISKLQVRATGQRPLNAQELQTLAVGTRLANATWKAGQVHRAAWEGNTNRITPSPERPFGTFDRLKTRMFSEAWTESYDKAWENYDRRGIQANDAAVRDAAQREAFARVVFEVWKDVIQLKEALAASLATPEARAKHLEERAGFQQQIAEDRAAELRGLSMGQLIKRARAQGVELNVGMSKAEVVARLSGLPATSTTLKASAPAPEGSGLRELVERVGQKARGGARRRGR